jgi:hypothetical protein
MAVLRCRQASGAGGRDPCPSRAGIRKVSACSRVPSAWNPLKSAAAGTLADTTGRRYAGRPASWRPGGWQL